MKTLFLKYKSVVKFIVTFLVVYAVLSFAYKFYLQFSDGSKFYPDYITNLVSKQTQTILNDLGYATIMQPHPQEPSMKLIFKGKYLARIVEGCNSVSVIILFMSFITAFSGSFKNTFLYTLFGSVLIYIANLLRIVVLSIGLYKYPEHEHVLHTVIFPAIIYGMLFLLWVFWVNRFSKFESKK
ncbi:exosortase family protein XrtF [Tamlana sp. 62-3]|uniref:Exosortase family protein XrtF n=1 Tax=Neotamlana sargassicola TaxID=2883125 RepID=A0A9X1I7W6_9FLAO|nr:exosortase family protein XrtF [Tamlana sargassicola]MCB4807796.1 exosortase family protein XrtF [Tamlana sargassicola]